MRIRLFPLLAGAACMACYGEPRGSADAAEAQAALLTDSGQAQLWREAAAGDLPPGLEALRVDAAPVRDPDQVVVPDRPAQVAQEAFPASVTEGLILHAVPELDEPYAGAAQVTAVDGEFITLDLGGERTVRFQAKARGGPLLVNAGEQAQIALRVGDPFARDDLLALRLEQDDFVYTLVGNTGPVRLSVPSHSLVAAQVGEAEGNTMAVSVTIGRETQRLQQGQEADFAAGLAVRVLASVAVQGEAANALPGRPYRIELIAWRTSAG